MKFQVRDYWTIKGCLMFVKNLCICGTHLMRLQTMITVSLSLIPKDVLDNRTYIVSIWTMTWKETWYLLSHTYVWREMLWTNKLIGGNITYEVLSLSVCWASCCCEWLRTSSLPAKWFECNCWQFTSVLAHLYTFLTSYKFYFSSCTKLYGNKWKGHSHFSYA